MAIVSNNLLVRGLSGNLGDQFVVRTEKNGRTIVSAKTNFENDREYSPAQLAQQQAFREAVAYAKAMKGQEIYITKANGGSKSPYNIAVADWFNRPEILEIDLKSWSGEAGQVIRMRVQDDVQVQHVAVAIADEADNVLEQGLAVEVGALWWEYTTTATASGNAKVMVLALDTPGHTTERVEGKALG
jgi:hypothetical protein